MAMSAPAHSGMEPQSARAVLMVRPASFGFNSQTAASNAFQQSPPQPAENAAQGLALVEFDGLAKADTNGDGLVDVTELAGFIDTRVPEISFQAFHQRQVPQMRIVGSNFPVTGKTAALADDGARRWRPVQGLVLHGAGQVDAAL